MLSDSEICFSFVALNYKKKLEIFKLVKFALAVPKIFHCFYCDRLLRVAII